MPIHHILKSPELPLHVLPAQRRLTTTISEIADTTHFFFRIPEASSNIVEIRKAVMLKGRIRRNKAPLGRQSEKGNRKHRSGSRGTKVQPRFRMVVGENHCTER